MSLIRMGETYRRTILLLAAMSQSVLTQSPINTSVIKRISICNVKDNHFSLWTGELFTSEHIVVHWSITNVELSKEGSSAVILHMNRKVAFQPIPLGNLVPSRVHQHIHT